MKTLWFLLLNIVVADYALGARENYGLLSVDSLLKILLRNLQDISKTNRGLNLTEATTAIPNTNESDTSAWTNIYVNPPASVTAYEGDRIELGCEANGGPPPHVFWITPHNVLQKFSELLERSTIGDPKNPEEGLARVVTKYVIDCAQPQDAGLIYCVSIVEDQVKLSTPTKLVVKPVRNGTDMCKPPLVQLKPTVTLHTSFRLSEIGTSVTLPCKYTGAENPVIEWVVNGDLITPNKTRYVMNSDGSIYLHKIEWSDMGVYTCKVLSANGWASGTTFLYPMAREDEGNSTTTTTSSPTANDPR